MPTEKQLTQFTPDPIRGSLRELPFCRGEHGGQCEAWAT